jgi:hypothetical protein
MLSDTWKTEAFSRFPELREQFEFAECDTPYSLWSELCDAFDAAYEPPRDESMIKRVYDYADWCCQQPRGQTAEDDLLTCVAVSFYEHIPESPAALADMPRWFTLDDVRTMKETFSYMVGEDGFQKILDVYSQRKS